MLIASTRVAYKFEPRHVISSNVVFLTKVDPDESMAASV